MFYFKATLHAKSNQTGTTNPTSLELFLPSTAIMGFRDTGQTFELLIKPDAIPKVHFEVGSVTASIRKTANAMNEFKTL